MLKKHSDIIRNNLSTLVENTDISRIIPILQSKHVLNQETILRILNPAHDVKLQTTNLYTALIKRGPQAYAKLRDALQESNHVDLANLLTHMDTQEPDHIARRPSLDSLGSMGSRESGDSDIDRVNVDGQQTGSLELPLKGRSQLNGNHELDSRKSNNCGSSVCKSSSAPIQAKKKGAEPCKLSDYYKGITPYICGPQLSRNDVVNIRADEQLPVHVVSATVWKQGPLTYKMSAYPRGCALVVNNLDFQDQESFPKRKGAENDHRRLTEMLEQLYFDVEYHENKTKMEMDHIVRKFSEKDELTNVDCVIIVFMSHGAEGASEEDTEIIGVDGVGYKTSEIVACFSNNNCKALIHKPKVFLFQACRGVLPDEGVLLERTFHLLPTRTETDGRKIESTSRRIRIRSASDVFIAYAVPPGRPANRDIFRGTWFIQTIVDVFSQYAYEHDLEDMMKMVDNKIKNVDNLGVKNFQAVATNTIGWSKKLYFNPGLKITKASAEASFDGTDTLCDSHGMDVVDNCMDVGGTRHAGPTEDEDENGDCPRRGCLPAAKCTVI